jgi:hypothetical protein
MKIRESRKFFAESKAEETLPGAHLELNKLMEP